jgi:dihydrofolate reductase
MNLIAAVDEDWNIGRDNGLLFRIPADMKYFREKTMGKVVVMGEATLRSLPGGKPLPGRTNIVLSDDPAFDVRGAAVVRSMDALRREVGKYPPDDVFVIGGASVYNQLMDACGRAYITKVQAIVPADKRINSLDGRAGWAVARQSDVQSHNGLEFVFTVYENSNVKESI